MVRVMSLQDFRLLFTSATTSLLGDQFALIHLDANTYAQRDARADDEYIDVFQYRVSTNTV
jgi:hypothetical protein